MTSRFTGSILLPQATSAEHALFQLSQEQAPTVRVECYQMDKLRVGEREASTNADSIGMSLECFLQRRMPPIQTQILSSGKFSPDQHGVQTWQYEYEFHSLSHGGRYHILAYVIDPSHPTMSDRYVDPAQQPFGFYARHENGNQWPWSSIKVEEEGQEVKLDAFKLRVPHSFDWLKSFGATGARTPHGWLRLLPNSSIPVITFASCSPTQRGHAHGLLLAPHILDFWYFYLFEHRFSGNLSAYVNFIEKWVDPKVGFFKYPAEALEEAHGIIAGMRAAGISLFLDVLERDYDYRDVLSGYIETRTVLAATTAKQPAANATASAVESTSSAAAAAAASASSSSSGTPAAPCSSAPAPAAILDPTLPAHHCSQLVVWGAHTPSSGSVLAGRNMDGEIDIRKVTATHSVLFATERDPAPTTSSYRTISCMWPGIVGTLTGVNETGLYLCENAGETQPDTGLVSGLTPVACIQQAALRRLDGRTLTVQKMKEFLSPYISREGWNSAEHRLISAEERERQLEQARVPIYVSETAGGFSGPGSIFVVAMPPQQQGDVSSVAPRSSASQDATDPRGFVVECDRTHTAFRVPGSAPPFLPDCLMATNHYLKLGFDDQGIVARAVEQDRSVIPSAEKCASLHPSYSGSAASNKFTNWNVPLSASTLWRFESGRNRLQAWSRARALKQHDQRQPPQPDMSSANVQELLQVMCPGYTEHAFMCEMKANGQVIVHVAVADRRAGFWDAPYEQWHSFEFGEVFKQQA